VRRRTRNHWRDYSIGRQVGEIRNPCCTLHWSRRGARTAACQVVKQGFRGVLPHACVTVFPCKGTLPPCITSRHDRQNAQLIPARTLSGEFVAKVDATFSGNTFAKCRMEVCRRSAMVGSADCKPLRRSGYPQTNEAAQMRCLVVKAGVR
jgi:hypothetical protein